MRTRHTIIGLTLLTLLAAPFAGAAVTVDGTVLAGPGGLFAGYATPVVAMTEGAGVTFVNGDAVRHNVVSTDAGPDDNPWCGPSLAGSCPLFWSPLVGLGGDTPVSGVEDLAGGTYEFYCTLHKNMVGQLVVAADAA